jgi:hypothetical protein
MSTSVFQIAIDNVERDILPSYRAAMHRLLVLATGDLKHGTRVRTEYASFVELPSSEWCDPTLFAIRYAISTLSRRFDISEHRLSDDVFAMSLVRVFGTDTEFDPSFEVLKSAFWVKCGHSTVAEEQSRLRRTGDTFIRLRFGQKASEDDIAGQLLEVQMRNAGLQILSGGDLGQSDVVKSLGDRMVSFFNSLAPTKSCIRSARRRPIK